MSNILFFCHLEMSQNGNQKKYWCQKQVWLSRRAILRDAECLENATLEECARRERERRQTIAGKRLLPPATHAQSLQNDGCERLWAPSSQVLVTGRVINHQTASRVYTVTNMNHNRNYGCYGRLWTCKVQPWPICYTSRLTVYETGEIWYNIAYYERESHRDEW